MRSRYAAFVKGAIEYLIITHDPQTVSTTARTSLERFARAAAWHGLEIVATVRGGEDDSDGIVEFIARGAINGLAFAQRERSRFRKLDGRWLYIDGTMKRA